MAYIVPIHRPSSVRHAIKLSFLEPDVDTLAVAKSNRLDFYVQTPDGLVLKHSKAIYGKVTLLNKIRPASSPTDHLFVGTDRFMYFVLSWDRATKQLRTEKTYHDLADKSSRDSQTGDRCSIDPGGRFLALEIYEGIVTVVPIATEGKKKLQTEPGTLLEPIQTRIPELQVRSSAFLYRRKEKDRPQFVFLYSDVSGTVHLTIRELNYTAGLRDGGSVEFDNPINVEGAVGLGASHIIPLSAPAYGFLVIGETFISYCDEFERRLRTEPLEQATIFVAWEQIDAQRFVLADEYGTLYLLMVMLDSRDDYQRWQLDVLGETSRATSLIYLDGGYIYVGSHQGDSQVIRIHERSMEVVQTFANVAPILDFAIMDMGNRTSDAPVNEYSSGQARIVTGSGAFKDGSLRSIRSGVGLDEIGVIGDIKNVSDIFSARTGAGAQYADTLIISLLDHTRAFVFTPDGDAEEVASLCALDLSVSTLLIDNTPSGEIVQVTASRVSLMKPGSGTIMSTWFPDPGAHITAVSTAGDKILLHVSDHGLVLLQTGEQTLVVKSSRKLESSLQLATLALSTLLPNTALVAFWKNSKVEMLTLNGLDTIRSEYVHWGEIAVPRSLLVAQVLPDSAPTLFIGMADGNVITYSIDPSTMQLSDRASIVLGTQGALFKALPRADGLTNVFTISEHPSLIYGSDGRIIYSAVTAENARCVTAFDAEAFPGAVAIATDEGVKLVVVDEERTTHVQTLPVHETVRRIAYSAELKAFGLGTIKRTLADNTENIESSFKLVDEIAFQELDTMSLGQEELVECCIRAKLDVGADEPQERFILGTSYMDDERPENIRGRILVFEVTGDRRLKQISETAVKGACRCLAICEGMIVAALVKTVVVYSYEHATGGQPTLEKRATYRTSTAPIDLSVTGDLIAIADLMKSVSLLRFKRGQDGLPSKLEEVARHYETMWATAVVQVDEHSYLESDAEGNLVVLEHLTYGVTDDDRRRLQVTSEMLLGEMVNRMRRIDVKASPGAVVLPRAFLATVEGSIYLFGLIEQEAQGLLMRLQENMADHVQSPGDVPFNKYRAFKTAVREADEPERFVDGELIERFLDCDQKTQWMLAQGLGESPEKVKCIVENLKRMH